MKSTFLIFAALTPAFAGLPSVGPDYQPPAPPTAGAYRDLPTTGAGETAAERADVTSWWRLYRDAVLDDLETRALAGNLDLRAAAARVDQARAVAGATRSQYFPTATAGGSGSREASSRTVDNALPISPSTTYRAGVDAAWEIDLFGRIRRANEVARNEAEASAATFDAVKLSLTAEVASTYFALREADTEIVLVTNGVELRRKALDLVSTRRRVGAATDFDVVRAEAEVASAEAEGAALQSRRASLQSALAILVGAPATEFAVSSAATTLTPSLPSIPVGLPSELLQRRPDVAAAERLLAAANARIGLAKAAFFPAISLTGSAGYASSDLDRFFQNGSRVWSIGPSVYLPLFQGGRNRANLARSRAAYEETLASYQSQVLVALREVQDALTFTRWLDEQTAAQNRALDAARRASALAKTRYDGGIATFFEVIDAQRTELTVERTSAQLASQRLNNSVALIKALGGGWKPATTVAAK